MPNRPTFDPRYLKARAALEEAVSYQQQGRLIQSEKLEQSHFTIKQL
jgi:hypothetical protein